MKRLSTMLILALLLVTACNDEEQLVPVNPNPEETSDVFPLTEQGSPQVKKQLTNRLARMLAKAMANPRVRALVKQEVLKQRDGDYNVLFARIKDVKLYPTSADPVTFAAYLAQVNGLSKEEMEQFLNRMETLFPLAQIAVPELTGKKVEQWNVAAQPLQVAAYHAEDKETVTAFDVQGQTVQLPLDREPSRLTAVISENERLFAYLVQQPVDFVSVATFLRTRTYKYYLKAAVYDFYNVRTLKDMSSIIPGSGYEGPGDDLPELCEGLDGDRVYNNAKDNFHKIKFSSVNAAKDAEAWTAGGYEMRTIIVIGNGETDVLWTLEKIYSVDRNDLINCNVFGGNCSLSWHDLNLDVITWDPETMGMQMYYEHIEEDGSGSVVTLTISATINLPGGLGSIGSSIDVEIGNNDEELGGAIVEYCDNTDGDGTQYNTGSLKFYVNQ
ncbi:MAG: hypothetical protein AAGA66_14595 [Bacteroidota bacterium]